MPPLATKGVQGQKEYCCEGHADRALRVVDEMKSVESFASDEVIYNSRRCGVTPFFDCCYEQQRRCGVTPFSLRAAETWSNAKCECVGECRLCPQSVSEARVAPAQC